MKGDEVSSTPLASVSKRQRADGCKLHTLVFLAFHFIPLVHRCGRIVHSFPLSLLLSLCAICPSCRIVINSHYFPSSVL